MSTCLRVKVFRVIAIREFLRCQLTFLGCRRGPTRPTFRGTHLRGHISTAQATDTLQGHVPLERAQLAEAAPGCYRASATRWSDESGRPLAYCLAETITPSVHALESIRYITDNVLHV
jgi:hypothetical protein